MPPLLLDEPGAWRRGGDIPAWSRRFARADPERRAIVRRRTCARRTMSLSAVLLCGGESHRMHRDKATIEWRHQPLWERQMQTLRELQPEAIFLSARSDPDWRPSDVTLV